MVPGAAVARPQTPVCPGTLGVPGPVVPVRVEETRFVDTPTPPDQVPVTRPTVSVVADGWRPVGRGRTPHARKVLPCSGGARFGREVACFRVATEFRAMGSLCRVEDGSWGPRDSTPPGAEEVRWRRVR